MHACRRRDFCIAAQSIQACGVAQDTAILDVAFCGSHLEAKDNPLKLKYWWSCVVSALTCIELHERLVYV